MAKNRSPAKQSLSKSLQTSFGKRLQEVRMNSLPRRSQGELAEVLEVTRTTISNIEGGRHRVFLDQVYDFARALNVPVSSLLPVEGDMDAPPTPSFSGIRAEHVGRLESRIRELQQSARSARPPKAKISKKRN
jgi:transcriptional regulator with XRE-family HTH domain